MVKYPWEILTTMLSFGLQIGSFMPGNKKQEPLREIGPNTTYLENQKTAKSRSAHRLLILDAEWSSYGSCSSNPPDLKILIAVASKP